MPSDAIISRQLDLAGAGAEEHVTPDGPFVHDPLERATSAACALSAMTGRPVDDFRPDDDIEHPDFDDQRIEWGDGRAE